MHILKKNTYRNSDKIYINPVGEMDLKDFLNCVLRLQEKLV
jgi:hypothetical protein